jgi:hypothetical protein
MAAPEYPQVGANVFAQGCEAGRAKITQIFGALNDRMNINPDERGLIDQLLYHITDKVLINVVSPVLYSTQISANTLVET